MQLPQKAFSALTTSITVNIITRRNNLRKIHILFSILQQLITSNQVLARNPVS